MPAKIKKAYYYALAFEVFQRKIYILRSEDYLLIEMKLRRMGEGHGYCHLCNQSAIDEILETHEWCNAGYLHVYTESIRYNIYIHKTDKRMLPPIDLECYRFFCDDPIKYAKNVILLDGNNFPYRERQAAKKCRVFLIPEENPNLLKDSINSESVHVSKKTYRPWRGE